MENFMIYNSIFKIKENFNIDNVVKMFSILFVCLIEFRILHQASLSLADAIFVLLIISIIARCKIKKFSLQKHIEKLLFLFLGFATIWVLSYLTPIFQYVDLRAFFDANLYMVIASLYLVAISISFFYLTVEFGWLFVLKAILYSGLLNALLGITGLLLFMIGIDSSLVNTAGSSAPYFEGFPRLTGFSLYSNGFAYSLFTSLIVSIPLYYSDFISKRFVLVSSIIIFVALIFSMAKIILISVLTITAWYASCLFRSLKLYKLRKYFLAIVLFGGLFLYILVTHIMLVNKVDEEKCIFGDEIIISKFDNINIHFCPSIFVQLKILYSQKGFESLPWGSGIMDSHTNLYRPHSTYLERFALHGVIGILSLFILGYTLSTALTRIRESNLSFDNIYYVFYLFWLMNLYIAINSDILRYRELWLMIGVTLGIAVTHAQKRS
jgi:hypothetical protein